jgi:outer membrane lipoprotein-sorting protein
MEATTDQLMGQAGQEQKSKTISTMVCDGEFMYSVSEANGEKSATKQNIMTQGWITDKTYFNNLRQGSKLKLLPDETVDGRSTYVIEATSKQAPPANQSGTTAVSYMYFDKETGLVIKWLSKDASGKVVSTSITTDLKVNSTISADRFVFKAPEGVEVMDLTKMQQQTAEPAQPEQEKPAPAEEAEKPKEPEQKDESKEPEKKDEAEEPEKSEKRDKPKLPDLPKPKWP